MSLRPPIPLRGLAGALLLVLAACGPAPPSPAHVEPLASPAELGVEPGARTLAPRLARGPGGTIVLSWLEERGDRARLRWATLLEAGWSEPATAAQGTDWFVNWADTPSVTPLGGGVLLAHWLQKTGDAPYAYAVRLARSADGGATWAPPVTPHADGSPTEHGFVSVVPDGAGGADLAWLDGRATAGGHAGGSTALMHATIRPDGRPGEESVLDPRVCDCCSTSAVRLDDGALVVAYRDRDEDETRDVSVVVRAADGTDRAGTTPSDGWVIAGCPVNGPALATDGASVALAWFTLGADGTPRVRASVSRDGGLTFSDAVDLTGGEGGRDPVGRVTVAPAGGGSFAVGYIADRDDRTFVLVRSIDGRGQIVGDARAVARTSRARSSGFPALIASEGGLVVAWTTGSDASRVLTARVARRPPGDHASAAPNRGAVSPASRAASILSRPARFAR